MGSTQQLPLTVLSLLMGLSISNIFYSQSLLSLISSTFDLTSGRVGVVPMVLQLGLLTAMVFVLPAGDLFDRRKMLRLIAGGASVSALLIALASNFSLLLLSFYCLGFFTLSSYILPAFVSGLVPTHERGYVIGRLLSGHFAGILLSRFFSGLVANLFGWRSIYLISALLMGAVALLWPLLIPPDRDRVNESYVFLISRQFSLLRCFDSLRRSCMNQGLQYAAFVIVWTSLALHLANAPWSFSAAQIGAFGLVGFASIATSAWIGRLVDRFGSTRVIVACSLMTFLGLVGLIVWETSIQGLLLSMCCIDFGVNGSNVANQSRVFSLDLAARSRLGALLFISAGTAASISDLLLVSLWPAWGWHGVLYLALVLVFLALVSQFSRPSVTDQYSS